MNNEQKRKKLIVEANNKGCQRASAEKGLHSTLVELLYVKLHTIQFTFLYNFYSNFVFKNKLFKAIGAMWLVRISLSVHITNRVIFS